MNPADFEGQEKSQSQKKITRKKFNGHAPLPQALVSPAGRRPFSVRLIDVPVNLIETLKKKIKIQHSHRCAQKNSDTPTASFKKER